MERYFLVIKDGKQAGILISNVEPQVDADELIELNEEQIEAYKQGKKLVYENGQINIIEIETTPIPIVEVTLDKQTAVANGTDAINFNFTIKNEITGETIISFSGVYEIPVRKVDTNEIYKVFRINVTSGQGQFVVKSNTAGAFMLHPEDFRHAKLKEPVVFKFVEDKTDTNEIVL